MLIKKDSYSREIAKMMNISFDMFSKKLITYCREMKMFFGDESDYGLSLKQMCEDSEYSLYILMVDVCGFKDQTSIAYEMLGKIVFIGPYGCKECGGEMETIDSGTYKGTHWKTKKCTHCGNVESNEPEFDSNFKNYIE